jgi:threonine dehydrogenase-like Zn-dependent dehydrogenase
MNAVYYHGGGSFTVGAASIQEPGPGEVRLDVAYCGVCGTDLHIAHGAMDARVHPPQVIGHEMSGTVAEVGERVAGARDTRRVKLSTAAVLARSQRRGARVESRRGRVEEARFWWHPSRTRLSACRSRTPRSGV